MELRAVGVVRSAIKTPMLQASESGIELQEQMNKMRDYLHQIRNSVCELVIFPEWTELLDGIEGFSHILVLYWAHLVAPERRNLRRVHPMGRKDLPVQGIFATCSPARPNPVLVSTVPLLEREGSVLKVKGLEAVDGSPVIDIKPYVQSSHGAENSIVPDWMVRIHRELEMDDSLIEDSFG
ncbi:MAG: tRNA (N6-threonylcarbamoyladenosine(37)-N6)-methyltransferase TrmO [Candidatus Hadarchaeaceae archaeon]